MNILIKIGSALISRNNRICYEWLSQKVDEMAELIHGGHRIVLVTSGAVAAGMGILDLTERPKDTLRLQMLSGMGQIKLIKHYKELFKEKGLYTAQVLLTHHNFATPGEEQTIIRILNTYMEEGIIPIINENDMVDKAELENKPVFTDNDILSALVARRINIDLAIILTDVDGLFEDNPKNHPEAKFLNEVHKIDDSIYKMADNGKSSLGLGGMLSKVKAAAIITEAGIETIVGNGNYPIGDILSGTVRSTRFKGAK